MSKSIGNSVFKINTAGGTGSGFWESSNNVVVTNHHVINGCRKVAVEDQNQDRYVADVIYINPDVDLAFLRIKDEKFSAEGINGVSLESAKEVESRDKVYVLGFPFGMPYTETEGIVSSPNQLMDGRRFIQTDAAVNPGNSGGPVISETGELIGVTTSKFTNADNVGFAIPAETLKEELASLAGLQEEIFSLKCNSCSNLVTERVQYCPNCGSNVDDKLFDEIVLTQLAEFVENSLSMLGIDPVLGRSGNEFWEFHQGSSLIRIFVFNREYLYATSPMNNLPKDNLERLYQYLLSNPVPPYKLGIHKNQIFLSYRAHISDCFSGKADMVRENLKNLPLKADDMDNFFVDEYGCEMTTYSKEVAD